MDGCEESDSRMTGERSQSKGDPGMMISVVVGAPLELCGILDENPLSEQRTSKARVVNAGERFCEMRCYIAYELRVTTVEVL